MTDDEAVFLGVDGGGTHSTAVAIDGNGHVLANASAGSLNFLSSGWPTARRNLKRLAGSIKSQLRPKTGFYRIVIGCAALFSEGTKAEREKLCRGILPLERVCLVSDCQTACFGATLGRSGIVVVAGTGSIVLAQSESGRLTRVGGWGHILGDAGSAYWIALESVKGAIAAEEGLGPKTSLGGVVRQWFKVRSLTEIVPLIYKRDFAKEEFAALAGHLSNRTGKTDRVFRRICRRAGQELASQALSAIKLAGLKARPVPVYPAGGVLEANALVRDNLVETMKQTCKVRIEKPKLSAVRGAAAMALADAGLELSPTVVVNLAKSGDGWRGIRS